MPGYSSPKRGKDAALTALEAALDAARVKANEAYSERWRAKSALDNAEKNLAVARRDVQDILRSMEAVRDLPTEPLTDYVKIVKREEEKTENSDEPAQ